MRTSISCASSFLFAAIQLKKWRNCMEIYLKSISHTRTLSGLMRPVVCFDQMFTIQFKVKSLKKIVLISVAVAKEVFFVRQKFVKKFSKKMYPIQSRIGLMCGHKSLANLKLFRQMSSVIESKV